MGFSKAWEDKSKTPKKAYELKQRPTDVKAELKKYSANPEKEKDIGIGFGGKN